MLELRDDDAWELRDSVSQDLCAVTVTFSNATALAEAVCLA